MCRVGVHLLYHMAWKYLNRLHPTVSREQYVQTVHYSSYLPNLGHINHFLRAPLMCQLILIHAFLKAGLGGMDAREWSSAIPVLQRPPLRAETRGQALDH